MRKAQKKKENYDEIVSMGLRFNTDLNQFIFSQFDYLYTLFDKYDQFGVLPYPGSHSEQPAIIMEIFTILNGLKIEEQKRQQRKIKNG